LLYLLQATLGSEEGYSHWKRILAEPAVKLILVGVLWLYVHHFLAGIRYLLLDVHIGIEKVPAQMSAKVVFALGVVATALIAWRIW
jgi:succinate dehydrogenase / fumarate reductase cytochrome b subunit